MSGLTVVCNFWFVVLAKYSLANSFLLWTCFFLHFEVVIQISLSSQKPSPSRGKKGRWGPCLHKRRYRSQKKLSVQEKQIWNFESEFIVWSASKQVCGDTSVLFTNHLNDLKKGRNPCLPVPSLFHWGKLECGLSDRLGPVLQLLMLSMLWMHNNQTLRSKLLSAYTCIKLSMLVFIAEHLTSCKPTP